MLSRLLHQPYLINFIFQRILRINSSAPFSVHYTSQIYNGDRVKIGEITKKYMANAGSAYYHGLNGIEIGEGTIIAAGVKIISTGHCFDDYSSLLIGEQYKIEIGFKCWLGSNCVILPGVKLGNRVVVAAGAVVDRSFSENCCVIGGVPARIIRKLDDDQ